MAVDAVAARMDNAFRDPLMIEMENLFPHDLVFQHRPAAGMALQAVLVVGYRHPLLGCHNIVLAGRGLARLAILAELQVFHGFLLPLGAVALPNLRGVREKVHGGINLPVRLCCSAMGPDA